MSQIGEQDSRDLLLFVVPGTALLVVGLALDQDADPAAGTSWPSLLLLTLAIVLSLTGLIRMVWRQRTDRRR